MIKKDIQKNIPQHVSIMMGGNCAWAKERNLSVAQGCENGFEKMFQAAEWFFGLGVETLSFLGFSAAEWQRNQEEVNGIMKAFRKVVLKNEAKILENGWRLFFSGQIAELPGDLPDLCEELEAKTANAHQGTINIYLNYSGRQEILDAVRKMIKNKIEAEQVHEGLLRKYLYHAGMEDPAVIIITGGEKNLGGFQLWQSVNSKLIFLEKDWPDFEEADVRRITNI